MKVLLIIISVLILLIILLSIPAYISIEFLKNPEAENLSVQIKYLFFKINPQPKKQNQSDGNIEENDKKNNKSKKKKEFSLGDLKTICKIYKHVEDDIADILYYFSKKAVTLNTFTFYLQFGTNDAMQTGIATGAAYAVSYNLLSLLNNVFTVEHCDVSIVPVFEKPLFEIDTKCIIKVKNVHITVIVFKVLKMYLKILNLKKRKER